MNIIDLKNKVIKSISLKEVVKITESFGIANIYLNEANELYLTENIELKDTLICDFTKNDIQSIINDLAIQCIDEGFEDKINTKSFSDKLEIITKIEEMYSQNVNLQNDKYRPSLEKLKILSSLEEVYEETSKVINSIKFEWLLENNQVWEMYLNEKIDWEILQTNLNSISIKSLDSKNFKIFHEKIVEAYKLLESYTENNLNEVKENLLEIRTNLNIIITESEVIMSKIKIMESNKK